MARKRINPNHTHGFLGDSPKHSKPKPKYQEPELIRKYREERDRVIEQLDSADRRLQSNG